MKTLDEALTSIARGTGVEEAPDLQIKTLGDTFEKVTQHIEDVMDGKKLPAVQSEFREINEAAGGYPPTLVVIAAMPGVGKSGFEASEIHGMARRGVKSLIFSMEDLAEWLTFRLLARESGLHQFALRYKKLSGNDWNQVGAGIEAMWQYQDNVAYCDDPNLTGKQILRLARWAVEEMAVKIIWLDNMTALRWDRRAPRMDLEIQDFLIGARALAEELSVPFVVLSHVKRREGLGEGDIPRLTDCSEASAFEKASRLSMGLGRERGSEQMRIEILKSTNGIPGVEFTLHMNPRTAMTEASAI